MEISCDEIQLHLNDFIIITMSSGVGLFMTGYIFTKSICEYLYIFNNPPQRQNDNMQVINAVHILD